LLARHGFAAAVIGKHAEGAARKHLPSVAVTEVAHSTLGGELYEDLPPCSEHSDKPLSHKGFKRGQLNRTRTKGPLYREVCLRSRYHQS
jgi:hypothetical protein